MMKKVSVSIGRDGNGRHLPRSPHEHRGQHELLAGRRDRVFLGRADLNPRPGLPARKQGLFPCVFQLQLSKDFLMSNVLLASRKPFLKF